MSGDLFFCSNNISLYLNFRPWRFTIYSNKLILIRKKVCRSIPFKKEWQKSVKSLLDFLLETLFLNYEISACPGMSRITWFLVFVTVSNHGIESINEDSKNLLSLVRLDLIICQYSSCQMCWVRFIWISRHWRWNCRGG